MTPKNSLIAVLLAVCILLSGILVYDTFFAPLPVETPDQTPPSAAIPDNTPKSPKLVSQEKEFPGFCGSASFAACAGDSDCATAGCSGQLCVGVDDADLASTCEFRECYNKTAAGVSCGCVQKQCRWSKK